jgi:hypothetical protein
MANETKSNDHIVHGSVPKDEWEKFLKTHFKPGKSAASPAVARSPTMGGICGGLGCPSTHPISGTPLTGCTVSTEHDGSTTIHCHYAAIARL